MNIFALAALGIIGTLLAVMLKNTRPEISLLVSLSACIIILLYAVNGLGSVFGQLTDIIEKSGINEKYFEVAVKACIIAYITQFASELCKDAGEGAIAVKLEMAGKVSIVILAMPVISGFINVISELLDKI